MSDTATVISTPKLLTPRANQRQRDNRFYLFMSIACAVGIFIGFSRTFYLQSYFGAPRLLALFQIHGTLMTAWMLLFVLQTALVVNNSLAGHRLLGYLGAFLAVAMLAFGTATAFAADKMGHNLTPLTADPEASCFFSLIEIFTFGAFVWAGFYYRRQRDAHQRLMLLATACGLMPSGIGRAFAHSRGLVTPVIFAFVLAGPIYDLISRRSLHKAYRWGLLFFFFTLPPFRVLLGRTEAWHSFVRWVVR